MAEENKNKQSKAHKEAPAWIAIPVGIIMVAALAVAFISPFMASNNSSQPSSDNQEKSYDTVPDVCTDNATLKASNRVKSVGSVASFLDAEHDKISSNKMIHRWNGEYEDGRKAQFSCYTTIESDGSETIDELWLGVERLL